MCASSALTHKANERPSPALASCTADAGDNGRGWTLDSVKLRKRHLAAAIVATQVRLAVVVVLEMCDSLQFELTVSTRSSG